GRRPDEDRESRYSRGNPRRGERDREYERPRDGARHAERDSPSGRSRRRDERDEHENDHERERDRSRRERDRHDRTETRERPRERDRERERERAGPSRRSASPPPRNSRARSARPVSPSASPPPVDKAKPNFAPSGLLAAATNTVQGADGTSTVLKYNEPPEARKPVLGWRLYVFKGAEQVELLHIHRQSAYLIGRDRLVADIPIEHPSCSKQHAVIQYRHVFEKNEFGESKGVVKPFIIDLESTNGTHVNDETIPVSRFYELKASDVIKFGQSTREYVLLHDAAS
ncbi:hypothetical protein PLICRDRAFT_137293, partial [Plicaturopsis crispa FD-325 SS-3]